MSDDEGTRSAIERTLKAAAEAAGGTVQPYPRPGNATRRVVLQDIHDSGGIQREEAVLEDDGTVRVSGADVGPGVSGVFGSSIDSYDWVYIVPPERVPLLIAKLGGTPDSEVLDLLADLYTKEGSAKMGELLQSAPVRAEFDNWMS